MRRERKLRNIRQSLINRKNTYKRSQTEVIIIFGYLNYLHFEKFNLI